MEQLHLRMLGRRAGETASDRDGLRHCGVAMQIVLSWFVQLAVSSEIRRDKTLGRYGNDGVVKNSRVLRFESVIELWQGLSVDMYIADAAQTDIAVRLYGYALVEL